MDRADHVVMSLSQLDDRYIRGLTDQYDFSLEFRLVKDGAGNAGRVMAESTRGINTERSVNTEIYLEAGKYNVLLKIKAEFDDRRMAVRDTVKHYVSTQKKDKLIQLAKKYNSAHMKCGVGDKEDRIFESLTVQEADKLEEDKPKSDSDRVGPADDSANDSTPPAAGEGGDEPGPPSSDPPVAESFKPAPGRVNIPEEKQDKSIENWSPVATIGLRLFTRKARVALSVVQEIVDISKLTGQASTDGKVVIIPAAEPTILVSGQSEKVGNVPPIGDPLPLTPRPTGIDSGSISRTSFIVEDTSKAFVILDSNGSLKLSSASSEPVSMSNGGVSEGAEKAEDTRSATEQRIELKTKLVGDKPYYLKVHKNHIVPETLDEFKLPWKWSPVRIQPSATNPFKLTHSQEPGYIYIQGYLHEHEYEILFEHTRKFLKARKTSVTQLLTVQTELLSPTSTTLSPTQLEPAPQPSSTNNNKKPDPNAEPTSTPANKKPDPTPELTPIPNNKKPDPIPKSTTNSDNDKSVIKTPPSSVNSSSLEGESPPETTTEGGIPISNIAAPQQEIVIVVDDPKNKPDGKPDGKPEPNATTGDTADHIVEGATIVRQLTASPVSTE